jgi:hypothetical protein
MDPLSVTLLLAAMGPTGALSVTGEDWRTGVWAVVVGLGSRALFPSAGDHPPVRGLLSLGAIILAIVLGASAFGVPAVLLGAVALALAVPVAVIGLVLTLRFLLR